jgi:hypothetical protein
MRIIRVFEFWAWVNARTGALATLCGGAPWRTESERADWAIQLLGFTWEHANGIIGLDRAPTTTREEAETVMKDYNRKLAA